MVNTTNNTRIRARNNNVLTSSTSRCEIAPTSRSLSSATTTSKGPKSPSLRVQLPAENSSQSTNVFWPGKNGKASLWKTPNGESHKDDNSNTSSCTSSRIKQCSVAMSRTESIMVSSAGDVIVCRCRRSSTPFFPPKARDNLNVWDKQFPCCDTELLSNIDASWSPEVSETITPQKNGRRRATSVSQISTSTEFSTYEWEKSNNGNIKSTSNNVLEGKGQKGKRTGNDQPHFDFMPEKRTSENDMNYGPTKQEDSSNETKDTNSGEVDTSYPSYLLNDNIGDDLLLSLPSFDYSHIIEGHNDMVPHTEHKKQEDENSNASFRDHNIQQKQNRRSSIISSAILEPRTGKAKRAERAYRKNSNGLIDTDQKFFHGVPLFLSTLSQVRITKVSANPLGAHVLMISKEALLFTYGLNHRGQLGIGFQSEIKNNTRGFHTTPTLITPLLENGGKAINCAAGVDHSLVVISTEGRRLQKLQTNPDVAHSDFGEESSHRADAPNQSPCDVRQKHINSGEDFEYERSQFNEKSVQYHQVYAFGRNNFMKLGLIRPHFNEQDAKGESAEDVVLPRRVGLQCSVWPQKEDTDHESMPSQGVFDIAASTEHSAALVRRATGDVEVYMWGNASLGALGLPINMQSQEIRGEIARKPSFKKKNISPLPTLVESLCHRRNKDPESPFATQISLGPYCSFVVLSSGKCMSYGFSAEGMLGHGYNTTFSKEPCEVFLPLAQNERENSNCIVSVSAGAFHALALSDDGNVFSWGINSNERLGLGAFDYSSIAPSLSEKKENLVVIEWVPQRIDIEEKQVSKRDQKNKNIIPNGVESARRRVSLACAGYDSSFLVTESGQVLSFGKRSGRLGMGEISSNINTPQPLYGGLHLFHQRSKEKLVPPTKMKTS